MHGGIGATWEHDAPLYFRRAQLSRRLLGGHGDADYSLGWQLIRQLSAVGVAIAWSASGSALCFGIVKTLMPLRHARDAEREGLDIADHGERAYSY